MFESKLLAHFHYNSKWLHYEIIDRGFLEKQLEYYNNSDDKNEEHYRYSAFLHFIDSRFNNELKQAQDLIHFIELVKTDDDKYMAAAAAAMLLKSKKLNDENFDKLCTFMLSDLGTPANFIKKQRVLRTLEKQGSLSDEEFACYMTLPDGDIHMILLDKFCNGDVDKIKKISIEGNNKTVRNRAKEQLKRYQK